MAEKIDIEVQPTVVDPIIDNSDNIDITLNRREYAIVTDNAFITTTGEAAPQWLYDTINAAAKLEVANVTTNKLDKLNNTVTNLGNEFLGTQTEYDQRIYAVETANESIVADISAIQAARGDDLARIVDLETTRVTETEARAVAVEQILTDFNTPGTQANSYITTVKDSYSNQYSSLNTAYQILNSKINDADSGLEASASAISGLDSRVTIEEGKVATIATWQTNLNTYISSDGGTTFGGGTAFQNTVKTTSAGVVTTALTYGTTTNINGVYYTAGFGLKTTGGGTGTSSSPYTSQFWVDATEFQVTDSTTGYTPFTISGGKINFNGKVVFGDSVIDTTGGTTIIDGGSITTGTIDANRVTVTNISASNITTTNALVGHTLQSSDFSTIGGTGFRLKANALDTYEDPTIYGAYIRGGTLNGSAVVGGTLSSVELSTTYYAPKSWPKVKISDTKFCNLYNLIPITIPYNSVNDGSSERYVYMYDHSSSNEHNRLSTLSTDITVSTAIIGYTVDSYGYPHTAASSSRVVVYRYLYPDYSASEYYDESRVSNAIYELTLTALDTRDYFKIIVISTSSNSSATTGGTATISWYN